MKSLFVIQSEYIRIAEALANDELTVGLEAELAINQSEMQQKGIAYGTIIKEFEYNIEMVESEIKRLTDIKKRNEKAAERLKSALKGAMELYDVTEIKCPTLKINFRKSESVLITDQSCIPGRFMRIKEVKEPDKAAIKEAIKQGEPVLGAELLITQNIQIR